MANIKVAEPVSKDQIRSLLQARCPDLDLGSVGPMITASSSRWVAAAVNSQGKTVTVMPLVRDMPAMLGMLLIMLTGLGLVIFAVTVMPKQRALAERVEGILSAELGVKR
ncbi:MAG: hypothetical protein AAF799_27360 [Myxococcota bacterium]